MSGQNQSVSNVNMVNMRSILLLVFVLGEAFGQAFNNELISDKILTFAGDPFERVHNQEFKNEPHVINSEFETPLNYFSPIDARHLRLVSSQKHIKK